MPPKTKYPTPSLRFHNGAWKILWSWDGKQYSVSTGLPESDRLFADQRRIEFAIALKKDAPAFPKEYRRAQSVLKYIEARYEIGHEEAASASDPGQWIDEYAHEIRGKNTKDWVRDSKTMLAKLQAVANGLDNVTNKFATAYMADIAAKPPRKRSAKNAGRGSPGTHNRTLTVFKKFYAWLVNTERHDANPFATVKRLKERKDTPIVYCTSTERDEIIELARATGWPEWTAVFIAFQTAALLKQWNIEKPQPSRSKAFKEKWTEFENAVLEHKAELESVLEHIGWNVCRHTFASLKVQDGVDVQKVARWIGDTLETCLLHYAQFIPKDRRDPDIDKG